MHRERGDPVVIQALIGRFGLGDGDDAVRMAAATASRQGSVPAAVDKSAHPRACVRRAACRQGQRSGCRRTERRRLPVCGSSNGGRQGLFGLHLAELQRTSVCLPQPKADSGTVLAIADGVATPCCVNGQTWVLLMRPDGLHSPPSYHSQRCHCSQLGYRAIYPTGHHNQQCHYLLLGQHVQPNSRASWATPLGCRHGALIQLGYHSQSGWRSQRLP